MAPPRFAAPLNAQRLDRISRHLARRDPALREVRQRLGPPPLWRRPANFSTFIRIILEQQVSLAAAKTMFQRTELACGGRVTAARMQRLGDERLRQLGYSRQKAAYAQALVDDVVRRRFVIGRLAALPDEQVRAEIIRRRGLGSWSADVYLLMSLLRSDVLPVGDLGLIKGLGELDGLAYASAAAIHQRTDLWRPYRAVGTRMIWQLYLANRKQAIPQ